MPDEDLAPMPLQFTQRLVLTIDAWPARVAFSQYLLDNPHLQYLTIDGDTVTIKAANGTAVYRLRRDIEHDHGIVAELVEGSTPAQLKRAARKFGG